MPDRRVITILASVGAALIVASGVLVSWYLQYRKFDVEGSGIFGLEFGFGPLVRNIVEHGKFAGPADGFSKPSPSWMFSAHRMPLIPWILAAIAKIMNSCLLAMFLKNLLIVPLLLMGAFRVHRICSASPLVFWILTTVAITTPALWQIGTSLEMEEGMLIAMVFYVYAQMLDLPIAPSKGQAVPRSLWGAVAINAALFLTKASMWPLTIFNAAVLTEYTRRRLHKSLIIMSVAVVWLGWGLHNKTFAGRFSTQNTWSAWCLYKGNNGFTASIYPEYTVDRMDWEGIVESPADFPDEWAYEAHNLKKAKEFIRAHPIEFLRLTVTRAYVHLLAIDKYPFLPRPEEGSLKAFLPKISMLGMTAYRASLGAILVIGLIATFRGRLRNSSAVWRTSTLFGLFFLAYATPYLIGFGYQRHVLPMILPAFACLCLIIHELRVDDVLGVTRRAKNG